MFKLASAFTIGLIAFSWGESAPASAQQTQADTFTRYELLAPKSQSFRIYYDVSATKAGAGFYYNPIRKGSEPDVHGVYDRMTGKPLTWDLVGGDDAKKSGLLDRADVDGEYIRVTLARPVPEGGRARMLIDKTYMDAKSYFADDDGTITFTRTLGIKRNAVVLPHGYELVSANYPSQVITGEDGRITLNFINSGSIGVPYEVIARPLKNMAPMGKSDVTSPSITPRAKPMARVDYAIPERASQKRDIVYFLQAPETHSFRLYHDYEETRQGMDRYLNVVRAGSKASNPSAIILDTGEKLKVETLRGDAITKRGIDIGQKVEADTELVAIWFDAVPKGETRLLRIEETYTDQNRYFPYGNGFIWDRSFGRSRNTVVLPHGYYLTGSAVPATVKTRADGRVELTFANGRPGNIDVFITGNKRHE